MAVTVASNVKAFQTSIRAFEASARRSRNANALIPYWRRMDRDVRNHLTYTHGSAVYRNVRFTKFLQLIDNRSVTLPVEYLGGDDNRELANAANTVMQMAVVKAGTILETGEHQGSINMFVREIGRSIYGHVNQRLTANNMPPRAEVSIVAMVDYANTLEYLGAVTGFLYATALKARRRYGPEIKVKYDYVNAQKFGMSGGTFPRIRLAFAGNIRRTSLKKPGRHATRTPRYENL